MVVRGCRDGFCENLLEASLMSSRPKARGLLVAKAEPSNDGGSTSGKKKVKKQRKISTCRTAAREEWEHVRGTAQQTPRLKEKEEQELLQALDLRFLCSPQ